MKEEDEDMMFSIFYWYSLSVLTAIFQVNLG